MNCSTSIDLEQLTLELLQQSAVAEVISEEFDLLVVDEFQDTNPIQLALFIGLAALVKRGAVRVGGWVHPCSRRVNRVRGSICWAHRGLDRFYLDWDKTIRGNSKRGQCLSS